MQNPFVGHETFAVSSLPLELVPARVIPGLQELPSNVKATPLPSIATQNVGEAHDTRPRLGFVVEPSDPVAWSAGLFVQAVPLNVALIPPCPTAMQKVVVGQDTEVSDVELN